LADRGKKERREAVEKSKCPTRKPQTTEQTQPANKITMQIVFRVKQKLK
jgi:hypothetical protein